MLRGDNTIQEIAARDKIHLSEVIAWKQRAVEGMKEAFTRGAERGRGEHEVEICTFRPFPASRCGYRGCRTFKDVGDIFRDGKQRGHSQRRACGLVGMDPRVYRYRSRRPDDEELRGRLRELAGGTPAFRVSAAAPVTGKGRRGVNRKKLYRFYKEERLVLRTRGGCKRGWGPGRR